jgi:hypothetical protein
MNRDSEACGRQLNVLVTSWKMWSLKIRNENSNYYKL